jgi:methylenetetrahydrofolate dehydrogenase (NADP+)/methenyltetrahydrofolate cyclohydrolase
MQTIDGKQIAEKIYSEISSKLKTFEKPPKLSVILASKDPASKMYIKMKSEKAKSLGIEVEIFEMPDASKDEVIARIEEENINSAGILVQLPLSDSLKPNTEEILNTIDPAKDVDGLTSTNLGLIAKEVNNGILPATVAAIMECIGFTTNESLDRYLDGKNIAIINDSNLIGKPLASLLSKYNTTVNVLNKYTNDIKQYSIQADIIVTATGQGHIFDHTYVKKGCTIIDVTSIKKNDKVIGDFIVSEELKEKADWITPVPGGVGPLTIACLLRNLVNSI